MIRDRYILKALNNNSFTVFIILLAMSLSVTAVRVLDNAANNKIDQASVGVFLLLSVFSVLPFVVQVSGIMGVLQTYQRFYADSEMVIWESSGVPLHYWLKPTMKVIFWLSVLVAALVLFVRPWMFSVQQRLTHQFKNQQSQVSSSPGTFQPLADKQATLYIEKSTTNNVLKRLFLFHPVLDSAKEKGRYRLIVAQQGKIRNDQSSIIHFDNGILYDITAMPQQFYRVVFSSLDLNTQSPYQGTKEKYYSLSLIDLLRTNNIQNHAELFWRLSIIAQTIVMGIFSLGFAYATPKKRNYINLLTILAVGMIYFNLINMLKSFILQQRIDPFIAFMGLHLGGALLGYGLVLLRSYHFSWRRWVFRKS